MRKLLKFVGYLLLLLVLAVAALLGVAYWRSNEAMARRIELPDAPLAMTGSADQLARGEHLAVTRGCSGCHGPDFSGHVVIEAAPIGRLVASNLTRGAGGLGAHYDPQKFERAIRHAVAYDGRPLILMPAYDFAGLSDDDVAALAAYLGQVQPVDKTPPPSVIGPLARVLWLFGKFPLLPVDMVPANTGPITAPPEAVTPEYGHYIAKSCTGCHGDGFSGGHIPGTPPDFKDPANLTPDPTGLKNWSEADFIRAMREGKRPDGSAIDTFMPWKDFGKMSDTELKAVWAYLQTLPAKPRGKR
jgi:mono/diheme cytochrome c family protein